MSSKFASLREQDMEPMDMDGGDEHATSGKNKILNFVCQTRVLLACTTLLAVIFFVAWVSSMASSQTQAAPNAAPGVICDTPACVLEAATMIKGMERNVEPCDDFFTYACGRWQDNNPIPDDKSSYSAFTELSEMNQKVLRRVLETTPTPDQTVGAGVTKARNMYHACMDEDAIEAQGEQPVQAWLTALSLQTLRKPQMDYQTFTSTLATMHVSGFSGFLSTGVGQDDKNSSRYSMFMGQSGLGLPDRDYYEGKNKTDDAVLVAYTAYLAAGFGLLGRSQPDADAGARSVLDLEIALAHIMIPKAELRDPKKTYNPRTIAEMTEQFPTIQWAEYFKVVYGEAYTVNDIVISVPDYLTSLTAVLATMSGDVIADYLEARIISSSSPHLSKAFRDNSLKLDKAVYGSSKQPERWKTCLSRTDGVLGFAFSNAFIDATFSGSSKATAASMIAGITDSFKSEFKNLAWMDLETVAAANDKADRVARKLGYPDWIMNETAVSEYYTDLKIAEGDYFTNVMEARRWDNHRNYQDLLLAEVDRARWEMNPPTVNAYYSPSNNEMVFPAGILQAPFFDSSFLMAANYGGMGVVMGHELSHGFDDQGANYDGKGNLRTWWTPQAVEKFKGRTECISKQYDQYKIMGADGKEYAVNGALTLGENIADNGGVRAAFLAYQNWVAVNGPEPMLPGTGFTPEQTFFVSFAQVWCANRRPELALARLKSDPHSPPQFRVQGALSNSPDFAKAFSCKAGTKMNPVDKCTVW